MNERGDSPTAVRRPRPPQAPRGQPRPRRGGPADGKSRGRTRGQISLSSARHRPDQTHALLHLPSSSHFIAPSARPPCYKRWQLASQMATGDAPAVVPFRGLALSVSRHPLPSRGAPALSSSPDAFGDFALPGLDTMDIEDEVDALGRVQPSHASRAPGSRCLSTMCIDTASGLRKCLARGCTGSYRCVGPLCHLPSISLFLSLASQPPRADGGQEVGNGSAMAGQVMTPRDPVVWLGAPNVIRDCSASREYRACGDCRVADRQDSREVAFQCEKRLLDLRRRS